MGAAKGLRKNNFTSLHIVLNHLSAEASVQGLEAHATAQPSLALRSTPWHGHLAHAQSMDR